MGKHTPGPWMLIDTGDDDEIWIGVNHPEVGAVTHAAIRYGCDEARELGEVYANALLIVAAPDLLEALIEADAILQRVGRISPLDVPLEGSLGYKMRAAIAKATGATP